MIPGLIIAAPGSGAGKTTVAIGLMAALAHSGVRVAPAKVGPDYIDPRFHDFAAGRTSINLDGWAMRSTTLDGLISGLASDADLIVVEGVMGLFDGAVERGACDRGSTADLAARTGWPVVLVVDASKQAQSIAALVGGFRDHQDHVEVSGVILNRVGSDRHERMLRAALADIGATVLGAIRRIPSIGMPSRHLGLIQAIENSDLETYVDSLRRLLGECVELAALRGMARPARFESGPVIPVPPLGQRIAIASDAAFGFSYPHIMDGWKRSGAEIVTFSPLANEAPSKDADAVFLPGGYPELYAGQIATAETFRAGMASAVDRGAWVYGECGGFMVMGDALVDQVGRWHRMLGLLPLETRFDVRRLTLGYRLITTRRETPFGPAGTDLRGHEFHYSTLSSRPPQGMAVEPFLARDSQGDRLGTTSLASGRTFGTYVHLVDTA